MDEKLILLQRYLNEVYIPYKLTPRLRNECLGGYSEKVYPFPEITSFDVYYKKMTRERIL